MTPGRTICFRGVDGNFTLGRIAAGPSAAGVLLIAGGIGITPLRPMFFQCIKRGIPVTVLHCVRDQREAIYQAEMLQVGHVPMDQSFYEQQNHLNVSIHTSSFSQCMWRHSILSDIIAGG